MNHKMEPGLLEAFRDRLRDEERSDATLEKYMRDVTAFYVQLPPDRMVNKDAVVRYKEGLLERYATSSINSMLSALNRFFEFAEWQDCRVRQLRTQRQLFAPQEKELTKEEYFRLLDTAWEQDRVLWLLMQTVCASGIRISELPFITAEAVGRGYAVVDCKGKRRHVILTDGLCSRLALYLQLTNRSSGSVFVTRSGKPVNRSNIWRRMKQIGLQAGIDTEKIYPHNLRHLFARTFYENKQDLAKLADVLGHSSIETTRIYVATSGTEHKEQLERLGLIL